MFRTLEARIKCMWVALRSSNVHIIYQRYPGATPSQVGFGKADLRDLVLMSKEIKQTHDSFIQMVNEIAAHNGELHNLQQLREAVEVIEKDVSDGRN